MDSLFLQIYDICGCGFMARGFDYIWALFLERDGKQWFIYIVYFNKKTPILNFKSKNSFEIV